MDLISLELNRGANSPGQSSGNLSFVELLRMAIAGIALHSIENDHAEFHRFQREMAGIAHSLTPGASTAELIAAIAQSLQLLDTYNRSIAVVFKSQAEEWRAMISSMNDTLQFIVSSSETSVRQLGFMESQLNRATGFDDLRQLRTYTSACLTLVRRESVRLQDEAKEKIAQLKNDVQRLNSRLEIAYSGDSIDPVTGLPSRSSAERDIANRIASGKPSLVSMFYIDRLISINGRFGNAVGDDVIMQCALLLAKHLSGAKLYRWSGPALCAVFDPIVPIAEAEIRSQQAAAQRLERTVDDKSILIIVGFVCSMRRLSNQTDAAGLFLDLDGFLSQQNRQRMGAS